MSKPTANCAAVLVDDNEVDLFLHEQLLRLAGSFSHIWTFPVAEAALDHLVSLYNTQGKADYPIMILLDIKMPDMDGFQFVSRLQQLPDSLKNRCYVVMISATLQLSDSVRAEANPYIFRFLGKPLTAKVLREVAHEILNK